MRHLLIAVALFCIAAAVPKLNAAEETQAPPKDTASADTKAAPPAVPAPAPVEDEKTARRAQLERTVRATEAEVTKAKEELAAYDDKVQQLRIKGKVTHRSDLKDETGRNLEDYETLIEDGQKRLKGLELAADSARTDLEEFKKKK